MAERLNKLSGKEWMQYSFSIWRDIQKNKEERTLSHPAMFPIMLAERLIDIFTNSEDQVVLDPFMGSGTTLIASQNKGHRSIGFEINKDYIAMAKNRLNNVYTSLFTKGKDLYTIHNDSVDNIGKYLENDSIDLTITSPPYWDILNRKRTADKKAIQNYGNLKTDFGNIDKYEDFLLALKNVFGKIYKVTKNKRYCIIIVMDIRKNSTLYTLHSDVVDIMKSLQYKLCDMIIWDRQKEYNSMRPLGYPYSYIINKVHEYILIFQKKTDERSV